MAVLLIIERHTMNNIFARLFCSNNKDVAEELTAMINNNRFNYRELLKIKDLVNDKLV